MLKPLKTIIITTILCIIYMIPTIAHAACAENEIDVLGDGTQCELAKFTLTTTNLSANTAFNFSMSAMGTFYVDCGAGGILSGTGVSGMTIIRSNTTDTTYKCTYTDAGIETIRFGGVATEYNTGETVATIRFNVNPTMVAGISGSLGAMFPTLGTAPTQQPMFRDTFKGCSKLTAISSDLFSGVTGTTSHQFHETFYGCSGLKSIPSGLFNDISGAPAQYMFYGTFYNCTGLTGSIPENLFSGISGAPAAHMFDGTFSGCRGLTGSIPENLFSGISGAPAAYMFTHTFSECRGLTGSIPENLFSGISGAPAEYMFAETFIECRGLTGSIPGNLFGNLSGEGKGSMFYNTFYSCSNLSGYVPKSIFENITSLSIDSISGMFSGTKLYTECPCGSVSAETGWGATLVDNRAVCQANPAEYLYNDVCVADCAAGVTTLRTSTGLALFDTEPTHPSLHIKHNGTICYAPMELGDGGAGSINIMSGGETYHIGTLE